MSIRLGDIAPDFDQESSIGNINFYNWAGNSWVILFSHPADFTPVCTTELGLTAALKPEFDKRDGRWWFGLNMHNSDEVEASKRHTAAPYKVSKIS